MGFGNRPEQWEDWYRDVTEYFSKQSSFPLQPEELYYIDEQLAAYGEAWDYKQVTRSELSILSNAAVQIHEEEYDWGMPTTNPEPEEQPIEQPKQVEKNNMGTAIGAAAVATPAIAAGIGMKTKYQPLPTHADDIEMQTYTDEVPTEQLIDHPLQEVVTETPIDTGPALRQRPTAARPATMNPNIMEPMDIMDVPMAAGGAAGGGILGGSTVSTLGAGAVGVGVLGLGGIIGAAIGTKKVADKIKEHGLTLPGSDYVGPGNKINIDAPRHAADAVAKDHDIAYQKLIDDGKQGKLTEQEFKDRLYKIDEDAINEFSVNNDWRSFVGKYGLKFKTNIEKALNKPIYPSCK